MTRILRPFPRPRIRRINDPCPVIRARFIALARIPLPGGGPSRHRLRVPPNENGPKCVLTSGDRPREPVAEVRISTPATIAPPACLKKASLTLEALARVRQADRYGAFYEIAQLSLFGTALR